MKIPEDKIAVYYLSKLQALFRKIINEYLQFPDSYFVGGFFDNFVNKYLFYRSFFLFGEQTNKQKSLEFFSEETKKRLGGTTSCEKINKFLIISDLYQDLFFLKNRTAQSTSVFEIKDIKKFNLKEYELLSKKYRLFDFLAQEIQNKADSFIDYFLIHGSYVSRDFIAGWSDLDTIIVLNDKIFHQEDVFRRARCFFQRFSHICYNFDLLAHHRFIFLTNFDLQYYPQSVLPIVVYKNCFNLSNKSDQLIFNIRNDFYDKKELLINFSDYFKRIKEKNITLWQYKKTLAMLLMLPSLLIQTKGIYLYKRESFKSAKKEFPQLDFSLIDRVSKIRQEWKTPFCNFYLNNYLIKIMPLSIIYFLHKILLFPHLHFKIRNKKINYFLNKTEEFSQKIIKLAKSSLRR